MQSQEAPEREIMAYALKELTKDWTQEEQINFSKRCFDHVVQTKYLKLGKYPTFSIQVFRQ